MNTSENSDLTIMDLLIVIKKNLILICLLGVAFGGLAYGYVKYKDSSAPYVASREVVVYGKDNYKNEQYQGFDKDMQRMDTYKSISENDAITQNTARLLKKSNSKISFKEVKNSVSVESKEQTTILTVKAHNDNKHDAISIANASAKSIKEKLNNYIDAGSVNVLAAANNKTAEKKSLSMKKYVVVGIAFGIIVGLLIALTKDVLYSRYNKKRK